MRRNINLRHRVTLQEQSETRDDHGQRARTWTDIARVWAAVEPLSTRELQAADASETQITHRVIMRYRADAGRVMRIVFGTRYLTISGAVRNLEERNEYVVLTALEGPANA